MLWIIAVAIFALNLPFGYWRAGVRKLSTSWFLAVHVPVPLAIGLRLGVGLGWHWQTLPLFVAAFFGGQWAGGGLRARRRRGLASSPRNGGQRESAGSASRPDQTLR